MRGAPWPDTMTVLQVVMDQMGSVDQYRGLKLQSTDRKLEYARHPLLGLRVNAIHFLAIRNGTTQSTIAPCVNSDSPRWRHQCNPANDLEPMQSNLAVVWTVTLEINETTQWSRYEPDRHSYHRQARVADIGG